MIRRWRAETYRSRLRYTFEYLATYESLRFAVPALCYARSLMAYSVLAIPLSSNAETKESIDTYVEKFNAAAGCDAVTLASRLSSANFRKLCADYARGIAGQFPVIALRL